MKNEKFEENLLKNAEIYINGKMKNCMEIVCKFMKNKKT